MRRVYTRRAVNRRKTWRLYLEGDSGTREIEGQRGEACTSGTTMSRGDKNGTDDWRKTRTG